MSEIMRGYYCDYCGRELAGDEVTYDERHEACGNRVGGQHAGRDHVRIRKLKADNARLQTLCDNLAKNGGKHANEEARLRKCVAELEAQLAEQHEKWAQEGKYR